MLLGNTVTAINGGGGMNLKERKEVNMGGFEGTEGSRK